MWLEWYTLPPTQLSTIYTPAEGKVHPLANHQTVPYFTLQALAALVYCPRLILLSGPVTHPCSYIHLVTRSIWAALNLHNYSSEKQWKIVNNTHIHIIPSRRWKFCTNMKISLHKKKCVNQLIVESVHMLTSPLKRLYSKKGLADLWSYSLRRRASVEDSSFLVACGTTSFTWNRLRSTGEEESGGEGIRDRDRQNDRWERTNRNTRLSCVPFRNVCTTRTHKIPRVFSINMYTGTCDTSIEIGIVQHMHLCGMRKYMYVKTHAYPARTQYMIFSTKIKRSTSSHLDSSSASHVMVFTSGFLLLHTRQHMLEPHETLRSLITQYILPYTPLMLQCDIFVLSMHFLHMIFYFIQ